VAPTVSLDVQVPLFAVLVLAFAGRTQRNWRPIAAGTAAILVNLYGIVAIRNGFVGFQVWVRWVPSPRPTPSQQPAPSR
jgi:hypothetical protein